MSEQDTDNAETQDEQLDIAAVVDEIAAEDAESTEDAADTGSTGDDFTPDETQIKLAKQLGFDDEYASNMTEVQAEAADQWGRKQSAYYQRKGKEVKTEVEDDEVEDKPAASAESSAGGDDDEFKEDDWYTDDGRKKINQLMKGQKEQKARDAARNQETQTSEKERLKADADKVFDSLDPEIFKDFSPGETDDIGAGSPAELKRNEVMDMAEAIQNASKTDISREDAIGQALAIVAPAETENAAMNEANNRRRKRGSQIVGSPASSLQSRKKTFDSPHDEAVDEIFEAING